MEAKKVLLVKYGEISLRKGNRALFEYRIMDTIRNNLQSNLKVYREQGRFLIENPTADLNSEEVLPHIKHIFGITGFCHAVKTNSKEIDNLKAIAADFLKSLDLNGASTFRVTTKRGDKNYPLKSNEISAEIGDSILSSGLGLKVELKKPDINLWVEIRNNVYFYIESERGEGGLPYGSNGKGVLLLSGGFDSPVAGYLAARRGVEILPVYFHSPPFVSERAADKVCDISDVLKKFTGSINLRIIPFTEIQVFLKDNVQSEKLTIMLKRAMIHVANLICEKEKAHCLIMGDSIGQVASQTIQSIAAVNSAASFPIIRPLSTMDKQEIIDKAKQISTFEISARPFDDCCTIFVADHPETKPNTKVIEKIEARLMPSLKPLLEKAVQTLDIRV